MENRTLGVLGTGTMGAGIVQLAAQSGYRVTACDSSFRALDKAESYVRKGLTRFAEQGVIHDPDEAYDRIQWTTNLEDFVGVEAVIEAVVERVEPKKEALAQLDEILPPQTLILTNTSSISITDLASATGRPEKVCGTHFFTPPPVREAVEVEKDTPGFVANRFLVPFLIEGARLLEDEVATKEEIDLLVKKGLGFPVGPFELGDFIGLDVGLDVISYIHQQTSEPYYEPPRILENLVQEGKLDRKTGEGFYKY